MWPQSKPFAGATVVKEQRIKWWQVCIKGVTGLTPQGLLSMTMLYILMVASHVPFGCLHCKHQYTCMCSMP